MLVMSFESGYLATLAVRIATSCRESASGQKRTLRAALTYMTLGTIDEVCKDQTVDVAKIATV